MTPIAIFATVIILLIINYAVFSFVIRKSSQSDEQIRLQQIQIRLLSRLLQEKGVPEQELENIVNL